MVEGVARAVDGFTDVERTEGLLLDDQYIAILLLHFLFPLGLSLYIFYIVTMATSVASELLMTRCGPRCVYM